MNEFVYAIWIAGWIDYDHDCLKNRYNWIHSADSINTNHSKIYRRQCLHLGVL